MASFYMPPSDKALAEAIAETSGGQVFERPLSRAIEVHGGRLVVTREMVHAHNEASLGKESPGLTDVDRTTWEMLKRNATGRLSETDTLLILEGVTEPGEEPKRTGCLAVLLTLFLSAAFAFHSVIKAAF